MLDKLKHTLKHTAIYSIGGIANKLIGLILLPLYTSYLTSYEYGMLAILEVTNQVLVSIIGLKLSTAMMRWYSVEKSDNTRKSIVFTSWLGVLILIVLYNFSTHPFVSYFSQAFFDTTEYSNYFRYLIIWGSFEILNLFIADLIRIKEKSIFYTIIMSVKLAIMLVLNILFVVKFQLGIIGIIYGNLIGSLVAFVATLPFLFKNINFTIQLTIFKEMLKFGIPLIFTNISSLVLTLGDRYLIKYFLSYHEVGLYSLGFKVVNVIKLIFIQSFQIGFFPIAYKMFNDEDASRFFSKLFTYFMLIVTTGALIISLFSKELLYYLAKGDTYKDAYLYVPLFALTILLRAMQMFFTLGFHYSKKTKKTALILFVAVFFNLLLNFLLIPKFQLYGASLATIISSLFIVYFFFKYSQKYYFINFEHGKVALLLCVFLVNIGLFYLTDSFSLYKALGVKIAMLLSLPVILYKFGFFSSSELNFIKSVLNKFKGSSKSGSNL